MWFDGEKHAINYKDALVVHRYHKTLEKAIEAEFERLTEK